MDKDLELFYEYLESPLWVHPITLFVSELYCVYAYNYEFRNGKNDEMNREYYQKYCVMLGDLLSEFSSNYELDTGKVSQLINTSIEQALPVAKHLIATQSYKQFVELMKSYTIELKMQPSVESIGLPRLTGKLSKSSCFYDEQSMEKKMQSFVKQRDYSLLMERRLALQKTPDSTVTREPSQHSDLTRAHLDTPGMAVAMAHGFVAYENTVEYKMEKWYKAEKSQKANTQDAGEDPMRNEAADKASHEGTFEEHDQHQTKLRRNSKSLTSQLDNIPEAGEDHLEMNKTC